MTRSAAKDTPKPSPTKSDTTDANGLEERIERLEKRLEETIASPDGPHVLAKTTIDKTDADPLRRAVERSNDKRDGDR